MNRVAPTFRSYLHYHANLRHSSSLFKYSPDLDYLKDENNFQEIERNLRLRRKQGLLNQLIEARSNNQHLEWFQNNFHKLPNRLHSRWRDICPEEAKNFHENSFQVRQFGFGSMEGSIGRKAELLFRLKGLLLLPQHEQIGFVGGDRSYLWLDELCTLRDALVSYIFSYLQKQHGFTLVQVPNLAYEEAVQACGFSTRSQRSQVYTLDGRRAGQWTKTESEKPLDPRQVCLAGTGEVPLAAMHIGERLDEETLPLKYCTVSRCYRAEVSPRAEESGIYRVHYFDKLEMFAFTLPHQSNQVLQEFVNIQQNMFEHLGLRGRLLDMPPHELGNSAARKYDFECWLPSRGTFGEISSASICGDYQSRRLDIKSKGIRRNAKDGDDPFEEHYVHTVNATACAIPRMLIAIAETHQTKEGDIKIPKVLWQYLPQNAPKVINRRNNCLLGKKYNKLHKNV